MKKAQSSGPGRIKSFMLLTVRLIVQSGQKLQLTVPDGVVITFREHSCTSFEGANDFQQFTIRRWLKKATLVCPL
jgi:hypothetical protein